jgi:hypothetical protein
VDLDILIDGESGLLSLAEGAAAEGMLERLEGALYSSGRVATRYVVNGRDVEEEALESALKTDLLQGRLEISTITLVEHLQMILQSFAGAVRKSGDDLAALSEGLTQLDPSAALEKLGRWCKDIGLMCQGLGQLLHMFNIASEDVVGEQLSLKATLDRLYQQCEALTLALQSEKRSGLADLLECDIAETLDILQRLFPVLEQKIEEALSGA